MRDGRGVGQADDVPTTAPMSQWHRGALQCGLAAVLFGATTPMASRLAADTNAPMLAGLLYLGAALAVLPLSGRHTSPVAVLRSGGRRLATAVAAGGLLGPVLLAAGLARTSAATASLLLNLELVATAVIAALFFGEHIGRRVAAGTGLVVLAGLTLAWSDAPEARLGALLIIAACVCWGLDNCVTADLDQIAPHYITLAKGVIAGSTNLALGVAVSGAVPSAGLTLSALVLGAIGYGASITLWVRGARDLGAARGQLIFSTAPFIGVLVAWTILRDEPTLPQGVSLALAASGVVLVLRSGHEHDHVHAPLVHEHEHEHDQHHSHRHDEPEAAGRHTHRHNHDVLVHAHPHVPDLHHRHEHG
jgi:drug/metabolite transporter (DMT)-like permease